MTMHNDYSLPYHQGDPNGQMMGPTQDERSWAMFAYLGTLLFGWIGLLIVYLVKGQESAFVKHHCGELLRLVLTTVAISVVAFALMFVGIMGDAAADTGGGLSLLAFLGVYGVLFLIGVGYMVLEVMGAIAANRGEWHRIPFVLRWG